MFDDTEPFPSRRRGHHQEDRLDARAARSTPVVTNDDARSSAAPAVGRGRTRRKLRLTVGQLAAVQAAQQAADGRSPALDEAARSRLHHQLPARHAHAASAAEHRSDALPLSMADGSTADGHSAVSHNQRSDRPSEGWAAAEAEASESKAVRKRTRGPNALAGNAKREGVSRAEGADGGTRAAGRKKGDHRVKRHDGMPDTPAWLSNMKSVARK